MRGPLNVAGIRNVIVTKRKTTTKYIAYFWVNIMQ